jgi:hypothetical protein
VAAKSKKAKKTTQRAHVDIGYEPDDWRDVYETIRRMRAPGGVASGAVVDMVRLAGLTLATRAPKRSSGIFGPDVCEAGLQHVYTCKALMRIDAHAFTHEPALRSQSSIPFHFSFLFFFLPLTRTAVPRCRARVMPPKCVVSHTNPRFVLNLPFHSILLFLLFSFLLSPGRLCRVVAPG